MSSTSSVVSRLGSRAKSALVELEIVSACWIRFIIFAAPLAPGTIWDERLVPGISAFPDLPVVCPVFLRPEMSASRTRRVMSPCRRPGIRFARATKFVSRVLLGDCSWIDNIRAFPVVEVIGERHVDVMHCLLYTSPSPRDKTVSRMPSSA